MNLNKALTVAVDGYSSCGKSTFAKLIAKELNYVYIDSGAMYRAITLFCIENNIMNGESVDLESLENALEQIDICFKINSVTGVQETWLNGKNVEEKIRGIQVSSLVSKISQIKSVRQKMVSLQRNAGGKGGVVMDGRDIGTVVFPNAHLKIFMTADNEVRAMRRYKELTEKGIEVSLKEIAENIKTRDHEDETRLESPLRKAEDAIVLDNSTMSIEQQMKWFRELWIKISNEL